MVNRSRIIITKKKFVKKKRNIPCNFIRKMNKKLLKKTFVQVISSNLTPWNCGSVNNEFFSN